MTLRQRINGAAQAPAGKFLVAGGAAGVVLAALQSATVREVLLELAERSAQGLLLALVAVVAIAVVDRRLGQQASALREQAVATAKMAGSVQCLAEKDQERERELDLALGLLTRNSEKTLKLVERHGQELNEMRREMPKRSRR